MWISPRHLQSEMTPASTIFFFLIHPPPPEISPLPLPAPLPFYRPAGDRRAVPVVVVGVDRVGEPGAVRGAHALVQWPAVVVALDHVVELFPGEVADVADVELTDRKSTRLNSSHLVISYAVFCLK